jgi:hypothetical protein
MGSGCYTLELNRDERNMIAKEFRGSREADFHRVMASRIDRTESVGPCHDPYHDSS